MLGPPHYTMVLSGWRGGGAEFKAFTRLKTSAIRSEGSINAQHRTVAWHPKGSVRE